MSLKDKIKAIEDIKKEKVVVSEWDSTIEVRTMSASQRAKLYSSCVDKQGGIIHDKFQAAVIIACCFDPETGEKLFASEDSDWIMSKAAAPIETLSAVAMKLSGLTKEVNTEIEKNS